MSMQTGKKISALRRKLGISQKDLASQLRMHGVDVTNQAVSKWENGSSLPNAQQFLILCSILQVQDVMGEFCGVDNSSILSGLNEAGRKKAMDYIELLHLSGLYSPEVPKAADVRRLPLYDIAVSAGTGQFLDTSDYELTQVDADVPVSANFGVRISGDSMEPRFSDGQTVWVRQQSTLDNGEIGVFLYDDNAYIKKLRKSYDSTYLVSLNNDYGDIIIDDRSELRILGKVVS